jgi:uncharacterized protein YcnI
MTASVPQTPGGGRSATLRVACRTAAATGLAGGRALASSGVADAHVRVKADVETTGSYSALTFRVPNESSSASTTKVIIQLPQDNPFLSVRSKNLPGWTAKLTEAALPKPIDSDGTTITKAVRTVTWTAGSGNEIAPGQYQEFSLSVGPLPAPGTVLLPTDQVYSDGTTVSWDDPTPASGAEPENPAPAMQVVAADPGPPLQTSGTQAVGGPDRTARWLGGGALALALAALALAVAGRRRTARAGSGTSGAPVV